MVKQRNRICSFCERAESGALSPPRQKEDGTAKSFDKTALRGIQCYHLNRKVRLTVKGKYRLYVRLLRPVCLIPALSAGNFC